MKILYVGIIVLLSLNGISSPQEEIFLKIGCPEIDSLNIWGESNQSSLMVTHLFYPSLFYRKPVTLEPLPDICTVSSEELKNTSPDGLIYTFPLQDDVLWDDGTPLTAHDFVFTFEMIQTLGLECVWSHVVESMKAVGPYTLEMKLKECSPLFEEFLLYFYALPAHQFRPLVIQALNTSNPHETFLSMDIDNPVGAGPFSFGEWEKGSHLKLITNPTYYGKGRRIEVPGVGEIEEGPHYEGILFKFYPGRVGYTTPSKRVLKDLQEGSIDYIFCNLEALDIAQLYGSSNITIEKAEQFGFYYLAPNCGKEPFDDVALRQALIYLVDKEFIVDQLFGDYAGVAHSVVMPSAGKWYNPNVNKFGSGMSFENRLRKAKTMLKRAGYAIPKKRYPEGVILLPSGEEMEPFEILTPPIDYELMRPMVGYMIQGWWRELGVPVTAKSISFDELIHIIFDTESFDWYIIGWRIGGSGYPEHLYPFFHSSEAIPGGYNAESYKNPEVDKYLVNLMTSCDSDILVDSAWKVQELVVGEGGYCPLYYRTMNEAHRTDIFEGWFTQTNGIIGVQRKDTNYAPKSCLIYLKPIIEEEEESITLEPVTPEPTPPPEKGICLGSILIICLLTGWFLKGDNR